MTHRPPDVLDGAAALLATGQPVVLVHVIGVSGSAPRPLGPAMAVAADGTVLGGLAGGCVEGTVHELALGVHADGRLVREHFGLEDGSFGPALTCGGALDVLASRLEPGTPSAAALAEVVRVRGERSPAVLRLDPETGELGRGPLSYRYDPPPALLVYGAVDVAAPLLAAGRLTGWRTVLCDARAVFATAERFPGADEVVVDWPARHFQGVLPEVDAGTAVCVLTHDPKFDVPLLEVALRSQAGFVGAMGSRRTHADRLERLRERGLGEDELARLRSPIGLDLGGRSPEETALAVLAEVVAVRHGRSGAPLRETRGSIHAALVPSPVPVSAS